MHDRLWFELGWDYASYDVRLPEAPPHDMAIGHREGKRRFRKPIGETDRFVRKWLHLRHNALRRNRHFEADVTADFLRQIDTNACPVTHEELTHGTLSDTDWSLDRIVNDGAYCRSNLVIMSTRANLAKSSMSFMEITKQCVAKECNPALTKDEWLRLLGLIWPTHLRAGELEPGLEFPVLMPPHYPSHLPNTLAFEIQRFLCVFAADRAFNGACLPYHLRPKVDLWAKEVKRSSTKAGQKILQKLLVKMERKAPRVLFPLNLLWIDSIRRLYFEWMFSYPNFDANIFKDGFSSIEADDVKRYSKAMHKETRGFISPYS